MWLTVSFVIIALLALIGVYIFRKSKTVQKILAAILTGSVVIAGVTLIPSPPPPAAPDGEAYFYWTAPSNSFGMKSYREVNWSWFKQLLQDEFHYTATYELGGEWYNGNQYLSFGKEWNDSGFWKLNPSVNIPVDIDGLNVTFWCNRSVLEYIERDQYEIWFNVSANETEIYSLMFNWSDLKGISGLTFQKGVYDNKFYMRILRGFTQAGYYEFDPWFGSQIEGATNVAIVAWLGGCDLAASHAHPTSSGYCDNITAIFYNYVSGPFNIHCALYEYVADSPPDADNVIANGVTDIVSVTDNGQYVFPFSGTKPFVTADTEYYIAVMPSQEYTGTRQLQLRFYDDGTGNNSFHIDDTYGNFPDPATSEVTNADRVGPIWCSYTEGEEDTFDESMFSHWKEVTINHSLVDDNLVNFPILFRNTSSDFSNAQSNGNDFAFSNTANDTQYNHEIEIFNSTSNELMAWVNITSLSSSTDTTIILHYGNETCDSQENITNVWDSNYLAVMHLTEINDSTYPYYNFTNVGGIENESGIVGGCYDLAYQDRLYFPDGTQWNFYDGDGETASKFTYECWLELPDTSFGNYENLIGYSGGNCLQLRSDSKLNFYAGTQTTSSVFTWNDYDWFYCNLVVEGETTCQWYQNKTDGGDNPVEQVDVNPPATVYNLGHSGSESYYGAIDEVRISSSLRSWEWLNTTYNTIHDYEDFLTVGIYGNYPPTQSGETPTNGSTGVSLTPSLHVVCSDTTEGDTLNATWWSNSTNGVDWIQFGSNETSFSSGTNITQTNDNFSDYSTKYWWSVNLSDGYNWTNETYHFTTAAETEVWLNVTADTVNDSYTYTDNYINVTDPPDITLVQKSPSDGTCEHSESAISETATFSSDVTEGNFVIACVTIYSSPSDVVTFSDNKGNSYIHDAFVYQGGQGVQIGSAKVETGGSNFIVTATGGVNHVWDMAIYEVSGLNATTWYDGNSTNVKASTGEYNISSDDVTPDREGNHFYIGCVTTWGSISSYTPEDLVNWTQLNEDESTTYPTFNSIYQINSSYPQNASWNMTGSGSNWQISCACCAYIEAESEGIQSKIDNTGDTVSGYLLMRLDYNDSGVWYHVDEIINETSPRQIQADSYLKLDDIWNGNCTVTNCTNGTGEYRIYVAFRESDWSVMLNEDSSPVEGECNFTYTGECSDTTNCVFSGANPANHSSNRNLALTWSITISDSDSCRPYGINWTIECENSQSNSGNLESPGSKSLSISGLDYSTDYKVWVNATDDGVNYTREWFNFSTKAESEFSMAIIANETFYEYSGTYDLQDLADWHNNSDTVSAFVVNLSTIYTNDAFWVNGTWGDNNDTNPFNRTGEEGAISNYDMFNDSQAMIRNYLRYAYSELDVRYALLVGDADDADPIFPIREVYASGTGAPLASLDVQLVPTDMYYAGLNGTWNADEDVNSEGGAGFGENSTECGDSIDEADWDFEISIGRFPVDDTTELSNAIKKTLAYLNLDGNEEYLQNITLAGFDGGFGGITEFMCNYSKTLNSTEYSDWKGGVTTVGFDSTEWSIQVIDSNADREEGIPYYDSDSRGNINNGTHIYYQSSHGSSGGWSCTQEHGEEGNSFQTDDVQALTNTKYCFVMSSMPCLCAQFDESNDAFCEVFITDEYGAFACIGNTRFGFGSYEADGLNSSSHLIGSKALDLWLNESISRIGDMHWGAKEYCKSTWLDVEEDAAIRYAMYEQILFGDPALPLHSPSAAAEYTVEIRNTGEDYFIWYGDNSSAWNVSQQLTGFNEATEYIAKRTSGGWVTYYGNGAGTNWSANTFDVVRILLSDSGTQQFSVTLNEEIDYEALRNVSLTAGYTYVGWSNATSSTLSDINTTRSNLTTGEWLAVWNRTSFAWDAWVNGFSLPALNKDVIQDDVLAIFVEGDRYVNV